VLLAAFVFANALAYHHATAMMCFAENVARTRKPEDLSFVNKARVLFTGVNNPRPESRHTPADLDLPYDSLVIACSNGISLAAWFLPAADNDLLIILFHGYAADKSRLLPEIEQLHDLSCRMLTVDFRGSGGSSESYTSLGVHEAEDVAETVAFAKRTFPHRKLILFGQSMGAVAILRAIDKFGISPDGIVLEAVFDTMLNTVKNRFALIGAPSFPAARMLLFWGGWQLGFDAFDHNPEEYARSVRCPVLFMHGTEDRRALISQARRVFDAVPTEKRFLQLEGLKHESYAGSRPEEWKTGIDEFIGVR